MPRTILVVDDEPTILATLKDVLSDEGFEVVTAADGREALDKMAETSPQLVLLDIWMPHLDGLECLERLKASHPFIQVVMMSGAASIETAVKATKLGAFDYLEKPLSYEKVLVTINNALSFGRLTEENVFLRQKAKPGRTLTGKSPAIAEIRRQIELVAPTSAWVLVTGENGTGKELVAHQIHTSSPRSDRPLVEVNCAAIPDELIESELFGYEKGAFTGATARKRGRFDLADGGTLFLDEIADMSLKTQAKILRILQERKFERVGGHKTISVDVRVVAATNQDLTQAIKTGRFREDLYYRLNVIPIHLPPLRERREDIPLLAEELLAETAAESGRPPKKFSPAALAALSAHDWPGNVRELRNLIERLVILSPREILDLNDLPEPLVSAGRRSPFPGRVEPGRAAGTWEVPEQGNLKEARESFERSYILTRLAENQGNVSATAERLGLERSHLYKKLRSLGIRLDSLDLKET